MRWPRLTPRRVRSILKALAPSCRYSSLVGATCRVILEGISTTTNPDGSANIAPMGPIVDGDLRRLELRPYQSSRTFENLLRTRQGVFHVSDDVELLARAAVDRLDVMPPLISAVEVKGWILTDCCRWYAFRVQSIDQSKPRASILAEVVGSGRRREFFGFNRGKHAVVEAAILATRVDFLPPEQVLDEFARLAIPVEKTGGPSERRAFDFLADHVRAALAARARRTYFAILDAHSLATHPIRSEHVRPNCARRRA